MATALYLIATIYPKADRIEEAKNVLWELIDKSKAEAGCEFYDLVQGDSENFFVMMEKWSSRELWDRHMESDHVKAMGSYEKDLMDHATDLRFFNPVN